MVDNGLHDFRQNREEGDRAVVLNIRLGFFLVHRHNHCRLPHCRLPTLVKGPRKDPRHWYSQLFAALPEYTPGDAVWTRGFGGVELPQLPLNRAWPKVDIAELGLRSGADWRETVSLQVVVTKTALCGEILPECFGLFATCGVLCSVRRTQNRYVCRAVSLPTCSLDGCPSLSAGKVTFCSLSADTGNVRLLGSVQTVCCFTCCHRVGQPQVCIVGRKAVTSQARERALTGLSAYARPPISGRGGV